jgi:uncharacterized repeat protein (TIGR03806 family)
VIGGGALAKRGGGVALALSALALLTAALQQPAGVNDAAITADGYPATLSAYGFFTDLAQRTPAARVTPYALNTPLFSDYSEKQRYLYLPAGAQAGYQEAATLTLPVGAALIKTFGYRQGGAFRALETRVLLRRAGGWVALPYVWNEAGTDAVLKRTGARLPVTFTDPGGTARTISYQVPNQNQCKDCHALSGAVTPIGPTARNLNDGRQLQAWAAAGLIDRVPADAPRLARWDDPDAPLPARAAAYLEVNCAHCHNARGAASNSGLWLDWRQPDAVARGIGKPPVAAGRGSGGRLHDIVAGRPDESILTYRMASTEPGVAMPELGRNLPHAEGLALVRAWIAAGAK